MDQFEKQLLDGVEAVQKKQDSINSRVDDLSHQTKSALENLDRVTKAVNDQAAIVSSMQRASLARQFDYIRDPMERFLADPQKRTFINAVARHCHGISLTPEQKTAIQGGDSGIGTAVTPQETAKAIYDILLEYGQWNTLDIMPIGSRTQILPLMTVRPTAYWLNTQGGQITEGAMTGSSVTLTIREIGAWVPVAKALLEDAEVDMSSYIMQQLAISCSERLDWACFAADGSNDATDGNYTGIAVGGTAATAANGNTTVGTLELDDFIRCLTTVSAGVLRRQARWWIHPTIMAKIVGIKDGNDRPIFQNALEAPAPGAIGSIMGYPVVLTDAMPSTDAAGQVVAVFGDPKGCAVGLRQSFTFDISDEHQFDYYRRSFRMVLRAGVVIKSATSFAMLTTAAA
jgi:HK97 family phage major capsid protein